jgi:hypothetical protein
MNNFFRIGNVYQSFFDKVLKKYQYIKNQDGFNMSCCKIDNNNELYCVRFLGLVPAYFGEEVIPGNYSIYSKKYIESKLKEKKLKIGKNFFWNSWKDTLLDNTIFFVGSYSNNKININTNIEPYVISNKIAFTNINEGLLKYNDVRLVNINNNIFCYDSLLTSIYQIKIHNNNIYIPITLDDPIFSKQKFYFKNKLCDNNDCEHNDCYYKKFDKNWAYIDSIKDNFEFLNWFENGYVSNTLIHKKTGICNKNNIIEMKGDKIDGLGNNKLPMFSFGSPFIKIQSKSDELYCCIGAGHIKIITTILYDNPNISDFFDKIKKYQIDDKYIEHNSYIYLSYYIKLVKYKNGLYKMWISDGYLYIDNKQDYKFSICFPMGIFEKDNKIIYSYGYGDYYNYLIEFEKQELLNNIIHDVSDFDITKYHFNIIEKSSTEI